MPAKILIPIILKQILKKTFDKKAIKENLHEASTKVAIATAGVAGAIEAIPAITDAPKSEAELITQAILAAVSLFLYYRGPVK